MIKLYGAKAPKEGLKGRIRDMRPAWLLEELGQAYEVHYLDPMKKENLQDWYLKLNPMGKVPTLDDDGFILFESSAICTYLADKFGKLIPKSGSQERHLYNQWVAWLITNIEPRATMVVGYAVFYPQNDETAKLKAESLEILKRPLKALEKHLHRSKYMMGTELGVVDLLYGSVLHYLKDEPLMQEYPSITAYMSALFARPSFERAFRKNGG